MTETELPAIGLFLAALKRIADELDQIDSRLLELIETMHEHGSSVQAAITDWVPE